VIPLSLFLLACGAVYLGAIEAAFGALMRLSLRLIAERSDRPDALADYLDDPVLLLVPVRLLLGLVTAAATALVAVTIGVDGVNRLVVVFAFMAAFVVVFELALPLLIIGPGPERVLGILLPVFSPVAKGLAPLTRWAMGFRSTIRRQPPPDEEEAGGEAGEVAEPGEQTGLIEGEERRLLQSIVDFGDALVREVMTPRPDMVGIREDATIGDLRTLFREQEYSRFPVYKESLDNIVGFVFVKDLVALEGRDDERPITPLLRPAVIVPESKPVPELLKQFQRQQTQIAVVVDEYGGTAGLVTIEDLLEEIVGEIRDEYDVESEPFVDEGAGRFVLSGKVAIDEVAERLNVDIERKGFETVGGYLLARLGRVPVVGEQMDIDDLHVEVLDVERRRVTKVRLARREPIHASEDQPSA
jgi:magnesium and cobalt exporter, CNNM family